MFRPLEGNKYKLLYLVPVVLIVLYLGNWSRLTYQQMEETRFRRHFANHFDAEDNAKTCRFPVHDPYDEEIMKYYSKRSPLHCAGFQPYLTYVTSDGVLRFNQSELARARTIHCTYSVVFRANHNDDAVVTDPPRKLVGDVKLPEDSDTAVVTCRSAYNAVIYENIHVYVNKRQRYQRDEVATPTRASLSSPSVFLLVIDSLSRLNCARQMPLTYSYLQNDLKANVFMGHTKTGLNTYPNLMTLLSGIDPYRDIGNKSWLPDVLGPYDDWPIIWRNFSRAGYVTMFSEESLFYGTFNWLAKGFSNPPTDYYLRPFWLAFHKSYLHQWSGPGCIGNYATHQYLLSQAREFLTKFSNDKYYGMTFISEITHEDFNGGQAIDYDVKSFLMELHTAGMFNNTVVIVMGDHGYRYGAPRATSIGRVEDFMPLFSMVLPESLTKNHPSIKTIVNDNTRVLTSWYDVHQTLLHILHGDFHEVNFPRSQSSKGRSLFSVLPENRLCSDAGVPLVYCVCDRAVPVSREDPHVQRCARKLVEEINALLHSHRDECAKLSLYQVLSSEAFIPTYSSDPSNPLTVTYRLSVSVEPSRGVFEGILSLSAWRSCSVMGKIQRTNQYSGQELCMKDKSLHPYCFCHRV